MKQKMLFIVAAAALVLAFMVGAWLYEGGDSDAPAQLFGRNDAHLVRMHSPALGKRDAKVQIVEFIDPACEACRNFYPMVKRILADHPDQIRLVLRWAPFHPGADAVVAVLEAARKQGKLWPTLEALLDSQAEWAPHHTAQLDLVWKQLAGLGLNLEQVRGDMVAPEIARVIAQDLGDAKALNINKTPTFFVNGRPLPEFGYGPLIALVNEALDSTQR